MLQVTRAACRCTSRRFITRTCVHTSACVSIRQHTSTCVSVRQHPSASRQHPSTYFSIRQHTSASVSIRQHPSTSVSISLRQASAPSVSTQFTCFIRTKVQILTQKALLLVRIGLEHPSTHVSIRQHPSAYVHSESDF